MLCTWACILMCLTACCRETCRLISHSQSGCLQTHGPCNTITTRFRPVPLTWHWCHAIEGQTELVPLLNRRASGLSHPLRPSAMRELGWDGLNTFRWGLGFTPGAGHSASAESASVPQLFLLQSMLLLLPMHPSFACFA